MPIELPLEGSNCPWTQIFQHMLHGKDKVMATIGLEKSFRMMYSNIGLNSRETVPLSTMCTWYGVVGTSCLIAEGHPREAGAAKHGH